LLLPVLLGRGCTGWMLAASTPRLLTWVLTWLARWWRTSLRPPALLSSAGSHAILEAGWAAVMFPLAVSAVGILFCMVTSFIATCTHIDVVKKEEDVERVLKIQLSVSALLNHVRCCLPSMATKFLPAEFAIGGVPQSSVVLHSLPQSSTEPHVHGSACPGRLLTSPWLV
jgi:hypothetical protein